MDDDAITLTFHEANEILFALDLAIDVVNGVEEFDDRILLLNDVYEMVVARLMP